MKVKTKVRAGWCMDCRPFSGHLKYLFTAVALMSGCGVEEGGNVALEGLTPADVGNLASVKSSALTTLNQQQLTSLSYTTYLGFSGDEFGNAIAVDGSGNAYITGTTTSVGATTNIFVAKMSPSGTNLFFVTFPGTQSRGIAVDSVGSAYVVGTITGGEGITKINSTGTAILYAATLGWNKVTAVKVDAAGNAYLTGSVNNGVAGLDVAVGKVNPTGTAFVYALAFGGTGTDEGQGIAIDTAGNAYIVGNTSSSNFPWVSAFQATLRGPQDAFVTKLNAGGTALLFSTNLGGNSDDTGQGIALDSSNSVYVTGSTAALNGVESFPVTGGTAQSTPGGGGDAYVTKFNTAGTRLWSTYVGGGGPEQGASIAVTGTGAASITGYTSSLNFPTTSVAFQRFAQGGADAFVAQLNTAGSAYSYSTYLGGSSTDIGSFIALDSAGNAYVSGNTISTNFPTNVYAPGGQFDAFVTKFNGP
jgi:hypothetical protein